MKDKRAAVYLRVSAADQTVSNQRVELEAAAAARGWTVVASYTDEGISGAKARHGCPQLDQMLKDAVRRKFNVVMVIQSRVKAGLQRAQAEQAAGKVRRDSQGRRLRAIGRPKVSAAMEAAIRERQPALACSRWRTSCESAAARCSA
jgi:hypothetical protein